MLGTKDNCVGCEFLIHEKPCFDPFNDSSGNGWREVKL